MVKKVIKLFFVFNVQETNQHIIIESIAILIFTYFFSLNYIIFTIFAGSLKFNDLNMT